MCKISRGEKYVDSIFRFTWIFRSVIECQRLRIYALSILIVSLWLLGRGPASSQWESAYWCIAKRAYWAENAEISGRVLSKSRCQQERAPLFQRRLWIAPHNIEFCSAAPPNPRSYTFSVCTEKPLSLSKFPPWPGTLCRKELSICILLVSVSNNNAFLLSALSLSYKFIPCERWEKNALSDFEMRFSNARSAITEMHAV